VGFGVAAGCLKGRGGVTPGRWQVDSDLALHAWSRLADERRWRAGRGERYTDGVHHAAHARPTKALFCRARDGKNLG
jgi:hypothetical protein